MSRVVHNSEKRITQNYGNGQHGGIDIGWSSNEEYNKVYANCAGEVAEIQDGLGNQKGASGVKSWGNYVLIKHANGMHSRYAHLRSGILVKKGQKVDEKTVLGIMGDSGNAYGRHLHFEVSKSYSSTTRINPTPYLTKAIYEEQKTKIKMMGHIENIGWTGWNEKMVGTTGQSKRLEAIRIDSETPISAKVHLQNIGWKDYGIITKDKIIGTVGQSRRLECLCLKGNFKYRVHIQDSGWTAWTDADGIATLGTVGQSLRIEAIEFKMN